MEATTPVAIKTFVAIGNVSLYLWFMRSVVLVLALLVGFGSTDALAKDAVLVKLRDGETKPAAKPTPTKSSTVRAKKKTPAKRSKAVAKTKPKPKKKKSVEKSEKSDEPRLRPMP